MRRAGLLLFSALAVAACGSGSSAREAKGAGCKMTGSQDRDRIVDALGYYPQSPSPLAAAVICNDMPGVEAALAAGQDPNRRETGGETAVVIAAAIPRAPILERLLRAGGNPNSYEADTHSLALHYALSAGVQYDDWSAYRVLLDQGADINYRPPGGGTIAEDAVSLGAIDKLLDLLDRGYRNDLPRLMRVLETSHFDAKTEPLRVKALERTRALAASR